MIEFFTDDANVVGTVTFRDGRLTASNAKVQSFIDAWRAQAEKPENFETYYDGWSNGYVSARQIDEES